MSKKYTLICDMCFSRNYNVSKNIKTANIRLELNKFCPKCNKHTLHKQTK